MIAQHLFIYFVLKRLNFHELWYIRCNPPGHVYLRLDAALLGYVLPALLHDGHELGVGRDVETGVREIGLDSAEINKPLIILFFTITIQNLSAAMYDFSPCDTNCSFSALATTNWWRAVLKLSSVPGPLQSRPIRAEHWADSSQSQQSIEPPAANQSRASQQPITAEYWAASSKS